MSTERGNYIQLSKVSQLFRIDFELCRRFADFGLIRIIKVESTPCIEPEEVAKLRHIVSLYRDLGVNEEGIEAILSMRDRIIQLQEQVRQLNRKVQRLEDEYFHKNIELPRKKGLFFDL